VARVLSDTDIAAQAKRILGDDGYKQAITALQSTAGNKPLFGGLDKFMIKAVRAASGDIMSFNLSAPVVNRILNWRSAAEFVPVGDWALGVAQSWAHPIETNRFWEENSALYRKLKEVGTLPEMNEVMNSKSKSIGAKIR
jgi:hypothetical protein